MWFAPEAVSAHTAIAREHPEWVLRGDSVGGDGHAERVLEGGGMFDLSNPEAAAFMTRYLKEAIETYGIDAFRTDSGGSLAAMRAKDDGPHRVGITEIRYTEALYRMWDELQAAFPHLIFDNCCGGGTRIDLETSSRLTPFWRTDSSVWKLFAREIDDNAVLSQVINASLNRYIPLSINGAGGSSPYHMRSNFNGGLAFGDDIRPDDYPRDELRQGLAECARLRKYLLGDFYPLTPLAPDKTIWCALQYHREAPGDGMVMVFRRDASPYTGYQLDLRAIDPEAVYVVRQYRTYDLESEAVMTGAALAAMNIVIEERPGSLLIEYQKQ